MKALTDSPVRYPEQREPEYYQRLRAWNPDDLSVPEDFNSVLLKLLSSPNIASKEWVYNQYDHLVMLNTIVGPGADAAVLRIKGTKKGIAMTTDGNPATATLIRAVGSYRCCGGSKESFLCRAEPWRYRWTELRQS